MRTILYLLLIAAPFAVAADTALDGRTHNFGEITEGDTPAHTFSFENTTDKSLKILKIRVPCGCARTSLDKHDLAPGENAQFAIEFNSKGRRGDSENSIYLVTDSKELPLVKYAVKAKIKPRPEPVCSAPSSMDAGVIAAGGTKAVPFDIENKGDAELVISKGTDNLAVVLTDELPILIPAGSRKTLTASIKAPTTDGGFKAVLKLKTNDIRKPELWITVNGNVGGTPARPSLPDEKK